MAIKLIWQTAVVNRAYVTQKGTKMCELSDLQGGGVLTLSSKEVDLDALEEGSIVRIEADCTVGVYEGNQYFRVSDMRAGVIMAAAQVQALGLKSQPEKSAPTGAGAK